MKLGKGIAIGFPMALLFLLFVFITACNIGADNSKQEEFQSENVLTPQFAQRYRAEQTPNGYKVSIINPWQGAQEVEYSFYLDSTCQTFSPNRPNIIPYPIERIVCLSTSHVAFVDLLGEAESIVGVSGIGFVSNHLVQRRFESGLVKEVGYEQALNYETIIALQPQVVFAYGVGAEMTGYMQKLNQLGVPVVLVADYLENSPLGKAEWLKFFSLFFEKYDAAQQLFDATKNRYMEIKELVEGVEHKPTVFFNLPWKDIWYMPGNENYMVQLIVDAGAQYIIPQLKGADSAPYSLEAALEFGLKSEFWLNLGTAHTAEEVVTMCPISSKFASFKSGRMYNNNRLTNSTGGNDFWESGAVLPHEVLSDLVKIFHPSIIEHDLVFYKHIQ